MIATTVTVMCCFAVFSTAVVGAFFRRINELLFAPETAH